MVERKFWLDIFWNRKVGREKSLVAEIDGAVAGYVTILPSAKHGPLQKSIQNYQILMCLILLEIKGLGINC